MSRGHGYDIIIVVCGNVFKYDKLSNSYVYMKDNLRFNNLINEG